MCAQLSQLILSNIRNLPRVDIVLGPKFNVFTGLNGSGKTSLLEAVYLLGVGRSFRARSIQQVISFGEKECLLRAKVETNGEASRNSTWVAVERSLSGAAQFKIGGQVEKSAAELSKLLPMQLIDVSSHQVLEGGPDNRRQFIDWGVFHMEHTFLSNWRFMRRALQQRNCALKQRQHPADSWNEIFIKYALLVSASRVRYVERFKQALMPMLQEMLGLTDVVIRYEQGWPQDQELHVSLAATANLDLVCGFTARGPHRANLVVTIAGRPIKEVLSRGQLKVFVCIMLLARAKLLNNAQDCIFLIDDLHAELDKHSCGLIINAIKAIGCQVFITGIDANSLIERLSDSVVKLFHVEQGVIRQASSATAQGAESMSIG